MDELDRYLTVELSIFTDKDGPQATLGMKGQSIDLAVEGQCWRFLVVGRGLLDAQPKVDRLQGLDPAFDFRPKFSV